MGFSTKQKLSDNKFEQLSGDTLTLGGDNIIGDDGSLKYNIQPTFTNDEEIITKKYVDDQIISGTSGITYDLSSPAAVEVGGITAGTVLTGKTSNELLEEILVPTLFPTFTTPDNGISGAAPTTQEVGATSPDFTVTATFDRGTIDPAYGTSGFRSGLPNTYTFTGSQLPASTSTTSLSVDNDVTAHTITLGTNNWAATVSYDAGEQPLDSEGGNYDSPLGASTTGSKATEITGLYPYFYGTSVGAPVVGDALIAGGTKLVSNAGSSLTINYGGAISGEYVWFAAPTGSKYLTWIEPSNVSNNGSISDSNAGDLFDFDSNTTLNSPSAFWSSIGYDVYYTRLATAVTSGILKYDK